MRDQLLQIKVSEEEKRILQARADKSGARSLSEWARAMLGSPVPERKWRNGPSNAVVEAQRAKDEEHERLAKLWTSKLPQEWQDEIARKKAAKELWDANNSMEADEREMTEEEIRAEERQNYEAIPVVAFVPPPPLL